MAKGKRRRRSSQHKTVTAVIVYTLAILLVLGAALVGGTMWYVNRQSEEQAAQASAARAAEVRRKEAFIKKVAPTAQSLYSQYKVFPSITIAQAILESDWGESSLSADYNNLFGVKGTDPNNTKELTTQEYVNGEWQTIKARFRVYASFAQSITDHAALFTRGTTWNAKQYQHVLAAQDYKTQAKALQSDGYATDPDYASKLIDIIETYNLTKYDPTNAAAASSGQ
ncbi:glycoside hydrolase family 73 protein [Schleiferilactobacillus shenzhenensis]|uniref:LytG n=1 Tax=Schleiferilactobacillus shenzhenensis LY-73 TaxID=1231336 RepID=U4TLC6_9LACO|nr:glycoside hydrolase family 73 protein [Schleiferilactobacillus shenzhenensis]ERL64200.1 LytG [Schleiferilactobacillus shenzhenensis LY-73]